MSTEECEHVWQSYTGPGAMLIEDCLQCGEPRYKPRNGPLVFAFDPGAHSIAWARFDFGRLARCGYFSSKVGSELQRAIEATNVAGRSAWVEVPQVYRQRAQKGDPNDLIDIAVTVGRIAAEVGQGAIRLVKPHAWKGSVPKAIMTKRIESKLDEAERVALHSAQVPKSLRHNVVDAIGIGLFALGRLGR